MTPQPSQKRRAFTLVELLVVVAIIIVLIAILIPSMEQAFEIARRARCAANLHGWGIGLAQYQADNNGNLPMTVGDAGSRVPLFLRVLPTSTGEISATIMSNYIPGVNPVTRKIGEPWLCPSNSADLESRNVANSASTNAFNLTYSYFGRVEQWEALANRPDDLTERSMAGGKLLASDAIFRWVWWGSWLYNHSDQGSSVHHTSLNGPIRYGAPQLTGANQLFGGGGVSWKPGTAFDGQKMESRDPSVPVVLGGPGNGDRDRTYY